MHQTPVVYVAGCGRSGSTLLELLLSQLGGVVAAGEVRRIWATGLRRNHLCACGSRFRSCGFWADVFERAFGGFDALDLESTEASAARVVRLRHLRDLARRRGVADPAGEHSRYLASLVSLYRSVAETGGAEVVIDSSKSPTYGHLLAGLPEVDLRVLHLVRDSRAVAYSWRRKKRRHNDPDRDAWMPVYGYRRSAVTWAQDNLLAARLRRHAAGYVRVSYEALAEAPEDTLASALSSLGLEQLAGRVGQEAPTGAAGSHSVMGNPVRFERRPPVVKIDDEWREGLDRGPYALVTLLTAPLLARYGYRLRG